MSEAGGGLFDGVLARGAAAGAVSDESWLGAMLEVEAALARALARAGVIPAAHAEAIGRACRDGRFDVAALGRAAADSGNPVVPLVAALTGLVDGPASADVHRGATSQDILDTAAMLVAARASTAILADLDGAGDAAARLADAHRGTVMVGRTLLQQATPTTFGAKAAAWLAGLDSAAERLAAVGRERLAIQLGGASGTLAAFGTDGPAVVRAMAEDSRPGRTGRAVAHGADADRRSGRRPRLVLGGRSPSRPSTSSCSPRPRSARSATRRRAAADRRRSRTSATRSRPSRRGPAPRRRPASSPRCCSRPAGASTSGRPAPGMRNGVR